MKRNKGLSWISLILIVSAAANFSIWGPGGGKPERLKETEKQSARKEPQTVCRPGKDECAPGPGCGPYDGGCGPEKGCAPYGGGCGPGKGCAPGPGRGGGGKGVGCGGGKGAGRGGCRGR